jgi:hypothetical protein
MYLRWHSSSAWNIRSIAPRSDGRQSLRWRAKIRRGIAAKSTLSAAYGGGVKGPYLGFALLAMTASAAFSQQPVPRQSTEAAYAAARNQLGILRYCQSKGFTDGAAVAAQNKMLALLPMPDDLKNGDAAERAGTAGKAVAPGIEKDIAIAAREKGLTEERLCQDIYDVVKVGQFTGRGALLP